MESKIERQIEEYRPLDCVACEDGENMDDLRVGERCANCGRERRK